MASHDPDLSRIFHALSDPTRRQMLARLGDGAPSAGDLAGPTGLALPTVMRHLGVLEGAGLIATAKSGRRRLCQAEPLALAATTDWLSRRKQAWETATDRLQALLATMEDDR